MSKQYNKTTFVGHPEMRYVPSGTPVTSFNVATNDQHTNEKGETVRLTTWYRCTAWGKLGEVCNQYLHKGSKVLVEGKPTPNKNSGRLTGKCGRVSRWRINKPLALQKTHR